MADDERHEQPDEMSEQAIREVFETLELSTAPRPLPRPQAPAPLVFFTVSSHSPPLSPR